ncbi:MAG TPA: prepilin peptidase [Stellaceae bacterium]|nr:prepilin peptidase [Stellaceae bacterium]
MLTTILAISVLIVAAYGDICRRRIPNELVISIAILGLARMIIVGEPGAALWTLAAGAAVLFTGFLLFWRGLIGGGDAKLLAAVVLLVGYRELADLLLIMSLVGGLLALVVIAIDRLGPWLPPVPVILSICGAPLRLAVSAEETLEGLLQFIRPPAARRPAVPHSLPMRPSVPYGVAIAAAGVTVLVFQSSLPG